MPMHLLYDLPTVFERLMNGKEDRAFAAPHNNSEHFPPVQVCEDEEVMRVRALLPGASLDQVSLSLENGVLIMRGVVPAPKGRHHRRERPTGLFQRAIRLPFPVAEGSVDAVLRDGVLTVTLPKAVHKHRRAIHIQYMPKVLS